MLEKCITVPIVLRERELKRLGQKRILRSILVLRSFKLYRDYALFSFDKCVKCM